MYNCWLCLRMVYNAFSPPLFLYNKKSTSLTLSVYFLSPTPYPYEFDLNL